MDLADRVIEASETNIRYFEYMKASYEPPWDGYCGLVQVSEDDQFREEGVVKPVTPYFKTTPVIGQQHSESTNVGLMKQ